MSNAALIMNQVTVAPSVKFIGAAISPPTANGGATTCDLSNIDIQAGDLIIGAHCVGEDSNETSRMSLSSSGYTLIYNNFSNDIYDINLEVYGKIADGTETSFATNATGVSTSSVISAARVFRGPSEVPTTGNTVGTAQNTDDIVWPRVGGLTRGQMLVYIGATGHVSSTDSDYSGHTDLTAVQTDSANDSEDLTFGIANKLITSEDSFTANTWTMDGNTTDSAVIYVILKLPVN